MKKNFLKYILLLACMFSLSACSDFFNTSSSDALDGDKYIDEESEMYSGFIGIMTKMQAIGDKSIYLTDTRAEMLEPTKNTPTDLYNIYDYRTDLSGNTYADPAAYYDVILACNDYLAKLYAYKTANSVSIDEDHYQGIVAYTLRIKAWTYLTIAKIYGEAIWVDEPLTSLEDISKYEVSDLDDIVAKCKNLLDTGFDGVTGDASHDFSWREWIDPESTTAESQYQWWDYMVPEYFALYAELSLWSGDYQKVVDLILPKLNASFAQSSDNVPWLRNVFLGGKFGILWDDTEPYRLEAVSVITYDYTKGQINGLLKHFETESPNEYLLAPSEYGMGLYTDPNFDPLGILDADPRASRTFRENANGDYEITKYRALSGSSRQYAYQADVHIYIYRGVDLYFMLAEALNNLERTKPADALINLGINSVYSATDSQFAGFTEDWTNKTSYGTRRYADAGIRGCLSSSGSLAARPFSDTDYKANDEAILNEMMLECSCEGRTLPAMIRVAKRYNDYNIIADRVCPKYGADSTQIREKILNGGYFIHWNLK